MKDLKLKNIFTELLQTSDIHLFISNLKEKINLLENKNHFFGRTDFTANKQPLLYALESFCKKYHKEILYKKEYDKQYKEVFTYGIDMEYYEDKLIDEWERYQDWLEDI